MIDLRDVAQEWRDAAEDNGTDVSEYVSLCEELGCEATPDELEHYADNYDPTLIGAAEFEDYAREFADECGLIDPHALWPMTCIDWKRAASDLSYDYSLIRYNGAEYYHRA